MAEYIEKKLLWADLDRIINDLAKPIQGVVCDRHESEHCMLRDRAKDRRPSSWPGSNLVAVRVNQMTDTKRDLETFRRRLQELYGG